MTFYASALPIAMQQNAGYSTSNLTPCANGSVRP